MRHCIVYLLFPLLASTTYARVIEFWPYQKLVDSSDLVAVVDVSSIENANDVLEGHGDSKRYQSHIAHLKVAWVIKGDQKMKKLDLVFFTYSQPPPPDQDGALFTEFPDKEKYQYLVFLKKVENDRFVATTGHYDASISVKRIQRNHFSGDD